MIVFDLLATLFFAAFFLPRLTILGKLILKLLAGTTNLVGKFLHGQDVCGL